MMNNESTVLLIHGSSLREQFVQTNRGYANSTRRPNIEIYTPKFLKSMIMKGSWFVISKMFLQGHVYIFLNGSSMLKSNFCDFLIEGVLYKKPFGC